MIPKNPQMDKGEVTRRYFEAGDSPANDAEWKAYYLRDKSIKELDRRYKAAVAKDPKSEADIAVPVKGATIGRIRRGEAPKFEKGN